MTAPIPWCRLAGSLAVTLALTLPWTVAQATSHLNCQAYAQAAVDQHVWQTELGCGLAGPAWSRDYNGHFNWCQTATMELLTREDEARKGAINACVDELEKKPGQCAGYAESAVRQYHQSVAWGCGFSGGAWSGHYGGHYNWCMDVAWPAPQQPQQARDNQLAGCRSALDAQALRDKQALCNGYARVAVSQQRENRERGCGFGGGAWSDNEAGHAGWCMSAGQAAADAETAVRTKALAEECGYVVCTTRRGVFRSSKTCRWVPK